MGLESASYISQLQPLNPDGADDINRGDDHIRLVKSVLQTQFPNFTAQACTPTVTELNYMAGVTGAVQTQLNAKAPIASPTFTGTPIVPTPTGAVGGAATNVTYVSSVVASVGTLGDLIDTSINTSGTSSINTREFVDTTGGVINRTLPAGVAIGSIIAYKDDASNFSTNKLTITPASGDRIENSAVDEVMEVTDKNRYFALKKRAGNTWRLL